MRIRIHVRDDGERMFMRKLKGVTVRLRFLPEEFRAPEITGKKKTDKWGVAVFRMDACFADRNFDVYINGQRIRKLRKRKSSAVKLSYFWKSRFHSSEDGAKEKIDGYVVRVGGKLLNSISAQDLNRDNKRRLDRTWSDIRRLEGKNRKGDEK